MAEARKTEVAELLSSYPAKVLRSRGEGDRKRGELGRFLPLCLRGLRPVASNLGELAPLPGLFRLHGGIPLLISTGCTLQERRKAG